MNQTQVLEQESIVYVVVDARHTVYVEAPGESAEHPHDDWVAKVRFFATAREAYFYREGLKGYNDQPLEIFEMTFRELFCLLPPLNDRCLHDFEASLKLCWSDCEPDQFPKTQMVCWEQGAEYH